MRPPLFDVPQDMLCDTIQMDESCVCYSITYFRGVLTTALQRAGKAVQRKRRNSDLPDCPAYGKMRVCIARGRDNGACAEWNEASQL